MRHRPGPADQPRQQVRADVARHWSVDEVEDRGVEGVETRVGEVAARARGLLLEADHRAVTHLDDPALRRVGRAEER